MPLVNSNGPGWSRPVAVNSARRLEGLNPVWRFIARLLGRKERPGQRPGEKSG